MVCVGEGLKPGWVVADCAPCQVSGACVAWSQPSAVTLRPTPDCLLFITALNHNNMVSTLQMPMHLPNCHKGSFRILHRTLAHIMWCHCQFSISQLGKRIVMSHNVGKKPCQSKEGPLVAVWQVLVYHSDLTQLPLLGWFMQWNSCWTEDRWIPPNLSQSSSTFRPHSLHQHFPVHFLQNNNILNMLYAKSLLVHFL